MGRTKARQHILAGRVLVNQHPINDRDAHVDRFDEVVLNNVVVQPATPRRRIMLHKPVGVISATTDKRHQTVIDLINTPDKHTLHLVGRLDLNTSGLVLLTNDGVWSKALMHPDRKVAKVYHVTTQEPIPTDAPRHFRNGFYLQTEDLMTLPAKLDLLSPHTARITLHEGRYRQVRRMFHRVGCKVIKLHRERIGEFVLPDDLAPGDWRPL